MTDDTDGYDLFCTMHLMQKDVKADEVTCACAKYLHEQGYADSTNFSTRRNESAVPTLETYFLKTYY